MSFFIVSSVYLLLSYWGLSESNLFITTPFFVTLLDYFHPYNLLKSEERYTRVYLFTKVQVMINLPLIMWSISNIRLAFL